MKKLYFFFVFVLSVMVCRADVITQKPAGNVKYYQRTSGLTYLNDGSTLHLQNQAGFTEIVYSEDGSKAWIKNPISGFFPEDNSDTSWVEGTLSGDGKTITVTLGQQVFYDESQQEYLLLSLLDKDKESHQTNYLCNPLEVQVTYVIDGEKVSLQGTSADRILGLVWSSDKSWCGYGDYETVYTEYELPEAVTPPASMETKKYKLSAIEYMNEVETTYATEVTVGFDGNDVYIQGLDKFIPSAWVKGTKEGRAFTFAVQYVGSDPGERRHFLVGWNQGAVGPCSLNYYDDLDAFECTSPVIINSNPTMHNYYAYYRSLYIGDRAAPVELPEGVRSERMMMSGKIDDTNLFWNDFSRIVEVARDGDKVYFRGLSFDNPDAWACGTMSNGTVTIPAGQFLGFSETSSVYLHGMNATMTEWQDVTFSYDVQENSYTTDCIMIEASAREPRTFAWRYKQGLKIYADENIPSGADPEDLPGISYLFEGECYSNTSLLPSGKFSRNVTVAFDGNLVYVKGFSPELPDVWVKGEMLQNVVTFANAQPLGNADGQALYFCGVDLNTWQLQDFTMSYDPDAETFTSLDLALVNKGTASPSYTVWYHKGCTLVKDLSGIEDVTVEPTAGEDVIYNLQGVRVRGELRSGQIYIINGKKVLYRR